MTIVQVIENNQGSHDEVRELTAKWVTERFQRYEHVRLMDAAEVGEEIKEYIMGWYGVLAADERFFPGGMLSGLLALAEWTYVGRFYLNDWIENHG